MTLSSLTLTNIRQFDNRTFNFQSGFNLLVGENGAGKTTVLRGILAVLGGDRQTGMRHGLEDDDIRLFERRAEVKATVQLLNGNPLELECKKYFGERVKRASKRRNLPLVLLYASNEAICSGMKVRRARRMPENKEQEIFRSERYLYEADLEISQKSTDGKRRRFGSSRSIREFVGKALSTFTPDFRRFYWRFEPVDCSLLFPKKENNKLTLSAETKKHARNFAMRFFQERGMTRRNPFEWPDQSRVIISPESSKRQLGGYLPELKEIWEDMLISSEFREILQGCSLQVKLAPRIMIERKGGVLNLSQLSDGEQRLFSLFVDIARQLMIHDSREGIGTGEAIVLIDEIDVHLHPKWQLKIIQSLEGLFHKCQFIATTHSPFIVQAAPHGSVQHMRGRPIGDVADRGIEEIAKKAMGVSETSARYTQMLKAAKEYLIALSGAEPSNLNDVKEIKNRLADLSDRFARNPAYQAFLELKTDAKFDIEE